MQRSIDQLLARVRDLEAEVERLRRFDVDPRVGLEAALVSIEAGNSIAAALGAVDATTGQQTIASGTATVLEIIDDGGTLKLQPIQNASNSNRETLVYYNASTDRAVARTSGASFLAIRLRDGRWVRVGGSGGGKLFLTSSTITARTGSSSPWTPGSGSGNMLEFYDASGTLKVRTTGVTETLRHMGGSTIASGRIVQCKPCDGYWLVDVDYC